jgi:hypothetical protein
VQRELLQLKVELLAAGLEPEAEQADDAKVPVAAPASGVVTATNYPPLQPQQHRRLAPQAARVHAPRPRDLDGGLRDPPRACWC